MENLCRRLASGVDNMKIYRVPDLLQQARDSIAGPVARIAAELMTSPHPPQDIRQRALLRFFKSEFFTWVNALQCTQCGSESEVVGMLPATREDLQWGADRVEAHKCKECSHVERFPRYNHPGKLLSTRRGRCGEWANCFCLCCHALGFRTRYVLDFTDHVWVEVFSATLDRWVHMDCCEDAYDSPLMYERGWGKKLSYVFAFDHDNIVDVTWRYSKKVKDTMLRRDQADEDTLVHEIGALNSAIQKRAGTTAERKTQLNTEYIKELSEFLSDHKEFSSAELQGRISGSLQWRRQRGEHA
eukprot:m.1362832 g.1362832  ORF g.1362832 m.1362832 type:complete len:300 (+) comp24944_c0_seq17:303-1202(+)